MHECLPACAGVPGARGGLKCALDPLEVELHMVVGCHVGAGNKT